jgi:hypothetical protein
MPKTLTDYSHTFIYKICCKDISIHDIYVGHTTNFIQRKSQHKTCCCNINNKKYNQYVYEFIRNTGGFENWSMIQIEERNCKNKRDAEAIEHYWIETLNAELNANKPYAMCKEEPQLYNKCWYEENKQEILEKAKDHKEEADHDHKALKEANKEKITKQPKAVINCECGNNYTFGNRHRHLQSITHIDYQNKLCGIVKEQEPKISQEEKSEILKQKQKEYREKNSEKIKDLKKENKETVKECKDELYQKK